MAFSLRRAVQKAAQRMFFPGASWSLLLPRTRFNYEGQVNGWQASIVMACVGWIQSNYPDAPLTLEKRGGDGEFQILDNHQMLDLLETPNEFYDGFLLQMGMVADLKISGNAYFLKRRSAAKRVVELWWVPSTLLEPKWPQGNQVFISHYQYTPGGHNIEIPVEDIVHFRLGIDPSNIRLGMSPLKSLFREAFTDDEAANMTASLLKNLGVPGLLISPEGDVSLSPKDSDTMREYIKSKVSGDKRGEPLVMSGATKVNTFGFNPQQMDLRSLRKIPEERISGVLGIPAIVAGLGAGLDRSTFANMAEAREMAYESGIIPLQRLVASAIKRQLLSDFEEDISSFRVGYDLSRVRVLQEDQNKLSERTVKEVGGGVLKVKDAQAKLNLPIDDKADFYLRPFNLTEVRSGAAPLPQEGKELKSWTEEAKTAHWKSIDGRREQWAVNVQQKIEPLYIADGEAIAKAYSKGKDVETALEGRKPDWTKTLEQVYYNIIEDFGSEIRITKDFNPATEVIREWIAAHAAESIKTIAATELTAVKKIISDGVSQKLTTTQIARSIRSHYAENASYNAMRVARTETAAAAGFGQHEAARQSGVVKTKTWISSRDDRVRDSHAAIDGETRLLSEAYSNGLMYPGDTSGSPPEFIQCRCAESYGTEP
jgi:HK97 family phage portal protein